MLVSNFELLLKPITPTPGTVTGSERGVLQGYFLTISNLNTTSQQIRLRFNASTPSIDPSKVLLIVDSGGTNSFQALNSSGEFNFSLAARDTALVILQPDITTLNFDPNNPNTQVEVRGFVEIFAVRRFNFPFLNQTVPLLVNPEHRGTFLPSPGNQTAEFDQLVYSLPTSTGGSLMNVEVINEPIIINPRPIPVNPPFPINPPFVTNSSAGDNLAMSEAELARLPEMLAVMAQQINEINQRLDNQGS